MRPKVRPENTLMVNLSGQQFESTDGCLYAPVLINSVIGDFLVDSGSPVILISYEYLESLGDRKPDLRSVETTLKSAGGNSLEVIGKS